MGSSCSVIRGNQAVYPGGGIYDYFGTVAVTGRLLLFLSQAERPAVSPWCARAPTHEVRPVSASMAPRPCLMPRYRRGWLEPGAGCVADPVKSRQACRKPCT